ncbi:MAG: MopE-related protein [bacterium]
MRIFALLALVLLGGCRLLEDPASVVLQGSIGNQCDFLSKPEGVCAEGSLSDQGACLPPNGYESSEVSCDNLDNDCDGIVDEGCGCKYLERSNGVCATAARDVMGVCVTPEGYTEDETFCDGLDNDCDGIVDEGCPCQFNDLASDACVSAITDSATCARPESYEFGETLCDNVDNDCDGQVDEGIALPCEQTDGVCANARSICVAGSQGACDYTQVQFYLPDESRTTGALFVCDGLDNDCDGVVDETCPCSFNNSLEGVCASSTIGDDGRCVQPPNFVMDEDGNDSTQCDGLDNDCDGSVDEGCACSGPQSCGSDEGACQVGTMNCVQGALQPCEGAVNPVPEQCDQIDNDCDGSIDEEVKQLCPKQLGVCADARVVCAGGVFPTCTDDVYAAYTNKYEANETRCDDLDNDCDGVTDEGCPCPYNDSDYGACGEGYVGTTGACLPPPFFQSVEAACDDIDNDCDGYKDEFCPCEFMDTNKGVCGTAVRNELGKCLPPTTYATTDRCDGLDNDCDGSVDEDRATKEISCRNGQDDDCDGKVDCADSDCNGSQDCRAQPIFQE